MKQTLNMRRQLAINFEYYYSARKNTQNMSASRSLPTIVIDAVEEKRWLLSGSCCTQPSMQPKFGNAFFYLRNDIDTYRLLPLPKFKIYTGSWSIS